jgi:hypothetical protein
MRSIETRKHGEAGDSRTPTLETAEIRIGADRRGTGAELSASG